MLDGQVRLQIPAGIQTALADVVGDLEQDRGETLDAVGQVVVRAAVRKPSAT